MQTEKMKKKKTRASNQRTWVSDSAFDRVTSFKKKLDHPGSDETTGAGDTDGLGRAVDWHFFFWVCGGI